MFRLAVIALMFVVSQDPVHAEDHDPKKFEDSIQAIEQKIAEGKSRAGQPLFIGSSTIRLWDVRKYFPSRAANNHGFGGSHISDSVHFFGRVVTPVHPSVIVFYAGDNDLANKKSPDTVVQDLQAFLKLVDEQCPNCRAVLFIAVKPSLKRWKLRELQQQTNTSVRKLSEGHKHLRYVDIWDAMLGEDGKPRPELFVKDGLHMSEDGYKLWT
ncbi:MAG: GDSL-type esterase/lipase family protein, partial [Planctomycetota bacterium]